MEINNIFTGFKNLLTGKDTPEAIKRAKVCSKCPLLNSSKVCTKCGCYIPAKVKAPKARCPIGKW